MLIRFKHLMSSSGYRIYPDGTYTRYIVTFLKDGYSYEITGFVFGPVDDNRDQVILEELLYLTEGLEQ